MKPWALGLVVALLGAAPVQEKKPKLVATTPEQGGADFQVQGEYEGDKSGAQVVAKGDGKFEVHILDGGLPGAGWDKKGRQKVSAKTEGEKTIIGADKQGVTKPEWGGHIAGGELTLLEDNGQKRVFKRVVRKSPTEGAKPPAGAVVLFDGTSAAEWDKDKLENGVLTTFKSGNLNTKKKFGNVKLHVEFMLSFMPHDGGQGRSNSGVYLAGRHEVQVLDSFGLKGENNECGGLYSIAKPAVNMCLPPLQWQTYDIEYKLATAEKGAVITVVHNGVKIHENIEIKAGKTTSATDKNAPDTPGPIHLQDHGNPVFYRNIWLVEEK